MFAVTGGQMSKIDGTFYLVGGQRFKGRYNPMGPDHGPGFVQEYSNQIRKFRIENSPKDLEISDFESVTDEQNLHRRDFNMLPQIFPNGEQGLTVFSGVFQYDPNVPFTTTVDIFKTKHKLNTGFTQFLSHYHSARVVLFSKKQNKTENIFFGGISQFEEATVSSRKTTMFRLRRS